MPRRAALETPRSLADGNALVRREPREGFRASVRPADDEAIHAPGAAKAKMDAGIVGGEDAAAGVHLARLLLPSDNSGDLGADRVAGPRCGQGAHGQPVTGNGGIRGAVVPEEEGEAFHVDGSNVQAAIVVEISERSPASHHRAPERLAG